MRGFKEMHNPASPHNMLKFYSSSNMGSQTGATKRLSLADGDRSVTIGDNMKEVSDLNEIRLAVRAMCRTAQLVMPWNKAYNTIDGFLHNRNYAFTSSAAGQTERLFSPPLSTTFWASMLPSGSRRRIS